MKLLSQNFMQCQANDCGDPNTVWEEGKAPYPLRIISETSEDEKIEEDFYSQNAKVRMIKNMDWQAFLTSLKDIEFTGDPDKNSEFSKEDRDLPETLPKGWEEDEALVNKIFNVSMAKEILTGSLN
mmetsp:Transcript_22185/g.25485  ORF Transcript_22185/g.25485 Transcript_22185/m.25485 type:complete len:126 (+) Transcript_22185:40-417(+)